MTLPLFIIDAFTHERFQGNSAAIVLLESWLDEERMQKIAFENNLSETAFVKNIAPNRYEIRWFSPLCEIDFCGHATLASAFVLFHERGITGNIEFITQKVGSLYVEKTIGGRIQMSFPNQAPQAIAKIPQALLEGLSIAPVEVLCNRQAYFAVYTSEDEVKALHYDSAKLKTLAPLDVVVTAKGKVFDFVSRYFWPANGGDEDPVTGSIHSGLAPLWASKLGKERLKAYQASKRGGVLYCDIQNDRVLISGDAIKYLEGSIHL